VNAKKAARAAFFINREGRASGLLHQQGRPRERPSSSTGKAARAAFFVSGVGAATAQRQ